MAEDTAEDVRFGNFVENVISQNKKIDYSAFPNDSKLAQMTMAFFLKYKMSQNNAGLWESIAKSGYISLEGKQAQLKNNSLVLNNEEFEFWRKAM